MKQATHSERERFVALMIRNCPTATASTCQRLMRLGATYGRLARSHDRTTFQTEKLDLIIQKICSYSRSAGLVPAFRSALSLDHSVVLTKGDTAIPIPTS